MSEWLSDISANKIRNTYFSDINNSGRALDISGNVVIRNENSLQFENPKIGTYIGTDISSNSLDGSCNIVIGKEIIHERLKQWELGSIVSDNSWNSIAYGDGKFVVVGDLSNNGIIYSDNSGNTWQTDFTYTFASYLTAIKKVTFKRKTSNGKNFGFNEIQLWMENINIALSENGGVFDINTGSEEEAGYLQDNYLLHIQNDVSSNYVSASTNVDEDVITLTLNPARRFRDVQAIVLYNVKNNTNGIEFDNIDNSGVIMEIFDEADRLVYSYELNENVDHYRFNGLTAYNDYVGYDSSSNIITDTNNDYDISFNKIRLEKVGYNTDNFYINSVQAWKTFERDVDSNDISFNQIKFSVPYSESGTGLNSIQSEIVEIYFIDENGNLVSETSQGKVISGVDLTAPLKRIYRYSDIAAINVRQIVYSIAGNLTNIPGETQMSFLYKPNEFTSVSTTDIPTIEFTFNNSTDTIGSIIGVDNINNTDIANLLVTDVQNFRLDGTNFHLLTDASINEFFTVGAPSARKLLKSRNLVNVVDYNNSYDLDSVNTSFNINQYIDISLNSTLSVMNDLKSIVIYTTDGNNTYTESELDASMSTMKGVSLQLFENNEKKYEYLISDTSNNNIDISFNNYAIYKINGNVSNTNTLLDVSTGNGEPFYDVATYIGKERIIDDNNAFNINPISSVSKQNTSANVFDLWEPLKSVAYGNGQFIAVGERVILRAESSDITNWKGTAFDIVNGGLLEDWKNISHDSNRFTVTANSKNIRVKLDSTQYNDLVTDWSIINNSGSNNISDNSWNSVAYGNDHYVVVSNNTTSNNNIAAYNINTNIWNYVNNSNPYNSIVFGNGTFVAVGANGVISYSTDTTTWTQSYYLNNTNWTSVRYLNNYFIAVANSGTTRIVFSFDGVNWTVSNSLLSDWNDLTYGENLYMIVANSNNERLLLNTGTTTNTVAIGNHSSSEYNNCLAIGNNSMNTGENEIMLGSNHTVSIPGNLGIGTSTPSCKLEINSNDAIKVPTGTEAQRPSNAENGMIRYNVDSHKFEGYANGSWVDLH